MPSGPRRNAAITAALTAQPVPVTALMSTDAQPAESALWHPVTATGTFDPARQVQVRLRQNAAGQPISEIVLPFRLTTGQTLLVDGARCRSWRSTRGVAVADPPAGQVTITGRVQDDQLDPSQRPPVVQNGQVQVTEISAAMMRQAFGGPADEPFLAGFVQLTGASPGRSHRSRFRRPTPGPSCPTRCSGRRSASSRSSGWASSSSARCAIRGRTTRMTRTAPPGSGRGTARHPGARRPGSCRAAGPAGTAAAPNASGSAGSTPVPAGRRRRSRDGFDRSQLWDDEP